MLQSRRSRAAAGVILVLLLPGLTGCATLGGAILGSLTSTDLGERPSHALHDLPRGRRLALTLRDGRQFAAWWVSTAPTDEAAYHSAWRRTSELLGATSLPSPLDTVTCSMLDEVRRGPVLAFGLDHLILRDRDGIGERIPFERIERLTWAGAAGLTSLTLHRLAEQGELPLPGRIRVERPLRAHASIVSTWADTTLDLADIRIVRMRLRGDGARVGAGVGFVLDMTMLVALMIATNHYGGHSHIAD